MLNPARRGRRRRAPRAAGACRWRAHRWSIALQSRIASQRPLVTSGCPTGLRTPSYAMLRPVPQTPVRSARPVGAAHGGDTEAGAGSTGAPRGRPSARHHLLQIEAPCELRAVAVQSTGPPPASSSGAGLVPLLATPSSSSAGSTSQPLVDRGAWRRPPASSERPRRSRATSGAGDWIFSERFHRAVDAAFKFKYPKLGASVTK